jgi:hypothetical protein
MTALRGMPVFDQIDATYYRMRANEEREKARGGHPRETGRHRLLADLFERKAGELLGTAG